MTTAHELPVPLDAPAAVPALRLVPVEPLDFDTAVRQLQPRLHRFAVRRLGDVHEAEELVQEALLRAYSHRHQLLTEDDLAAWTTVVTGRLVIDRLRVRGRSTPVADVPEPSTLGRDTADVVVARDEARLALDSLDAMPPRQAALLWAREVEGSSYDDLCRRFAMSEPAVRSVLTRARKALRKEYASRGGTLPVGGLAVLAPWVVGLSWAAKLRQAAARVTAPAALSALGISALGGLVLSPFGVAPHHVPGRLQVSPAVVTGTADAGALGVAAAAPTSHQSLSSAARPAVGTPHRTALEASVRRLTYGCVNDTPGTGTGGGTVDTGTALPKQTGAGSSTCGTAQAVTKATLVATPTLPANPTGITQLGIASDYLDCSKLPTTPLYTCTQRTGAQP